MRITISHRILRYAIISLALFFIVLIFIVAVLTSINKNSVKKQILPASDVTSFTDQFNSYSLDPSWQWENPSGNATYEVTGNALRISPAHGDDQWIGIDKASRVLRAQRLAPWTIETKIVANNAAIISQNLGGLVIFKDSQNWLIWGQLGNNQLEASGIINNTFTQPVATIATKYNYLRIRRIGNSYYFDASSDGANWTNGNVWQDSTSSLDGARYGFLAKDWSGGSGTSYSIDFDYFREYATDLMPSILSGTTNTTQIAKEIGSEAINNTGAVDVCGTDLGSMFDLNGKTYIAFGDTSKCPLAVANIDRSSTMAYTSDTNFSDGLTFDNWIKTGSRAKELFAEDAGSVTAIPTHGVSIATTGYLFYMQVTNWNAPGGWTCNLSSIAQ